MVKKGVLSQYKLERELKKAVDAGQDADCARAVRIRRLWLSENLEGMNADSIITKTEESSKGLPYSEFDFERFYRQTLGKNCENVIGFVPLPLGFVGPLLLDGRSYYVPMATTEGALLASTNRGCRAISESGGANSRVYNDGMTRAPVIALPTAVRAAEVMMWLQATENFTTLKQAFESTTRYGKLTDIDCSLAGRHLHVRFKCKTGDAMGMNMISKGVLECMTVLESEFKDIEVLSLSGNVCTDKKPSAVNWIRGRGKSVVCEVILSSHVVVDVLKCTVTSLVELNKQKNLVGSALAGSIGGNNAHASNIVTACFLATGQDPAQNVESSNCMTLMEAVEDGVRVTVTMPSLEVGTIGGGTALGAQQACLRMLGVSGSHATTPGANASQLAQIIAGTVLAGEISLMSALASNHLVSAHLKLNRDDSKAKKK